MNLVYVGNSSDSVYRTQSVQLLQHLVKKGWKIKHLEGVRLKGYFRRDRVQSDFETFRFPILPVLPCFAFFQALILCFYFKKISSLSSSVIHVRSDVLGAILANHYKLLGLREQQILIDVRGATLEEFEEFRFKSLSLFSWMKRRALRRLRKGLAGRACRFTAISPALCEYVLTTYHSQCALVPCISPFPARGRASRDDKLSARRELGLPEKKMLLANVNGGNSPWQLGIDAIEEIASEQVFVLNLSRVECESPFVITKFLKGSDYEKALLACDAALMLRTPSIVNKVSVPIKFLEYCSFKLPVIANGTIESVCSFIEKTGSGWIIGDRKEINFEALSSLVAQRNQICSEHILDSWLSSFSLETVLDRYLNEYHSILSSCNS